MKTLDSTILLKRNKAGNRWRVAPPDCQYGRSLSGATFPVTESSIKLYCLQLV